jgi:hypothetical protein
MVATLSDDEISNLMQESKPLPSDYRTKIQIRPKRGHQESELDVAGEDGNEFRLIIRQSLSNPLDFSIILAYRPQKSTQLFRICRYNGKSHEHTNSIETETFYNYHIHVATQRYQEIGAREDAYAQPTDRFADYQQAIRCMLDDCGFVLPPEPQGSLFEDI